MLNAMLMSLYTLMEIHPTAAAVNTFQGHRLLVVPEEKSVDHHSHNDTSFTVMY